MSARKTVDLAFTLVLGAQLIMNVLIGVIGLRRQTRWWRSS